MFYYISLKEVFIISINEQAMKELMNGIAFYVDKKIKEASFDKTEKAIILTDNNDGTYNIQINGVSYNNIKSQITGLSVNDVVNVIIPKNNYNLLYIDDYFHTITNITDDIDVLKLKTTKLEYIDSQTKINSDLIINGTVSGYIPTNLIQNPDFKINQRGQLSYTSGFTVDRWKIQTTGTTVQVNDNGITIGKASTIGLLAQQTEYHCNGLTFTMTVKELGQEPISYTFNDNLPLAQAYDGDNIPINDNGWYFDIYRAVNYDYVQARIINETTDTTPLSLEWVKLERSSIATPFEEPDFGLELLKCQRYGQWTSNGTVHTKDFRPTMRTDPAKYQIGDLWWNEAEL